MNLKDYRYPDNIVKLFETNKLNLSLCCNIYHKKLFIEKNIFLDEKVKYTEDLDCSLRLFLNAQIIDIINEPIYIYRQNQNSATHSHNVKQVEDEMNFVLRWNDYAEQLENTELKKYLLYFVQYQYSIAVASLFLLSKQDRRNMYSMVKKHSKMLEHGSGKKGMLVHYCYKILGFNITGRLMAGWIKNKEKINR